MNRKYAKLQNMKNSPISILVAGDFVPHTDVNISANLIKFVRACDFSIINLETPLTSCEKRIRKTGRNFKNDPNGVDYILDAGFKAVALSNNHIRDYGCQGVNDTINICHKNGLMTVGAGSNIKDAAMPLTVDLKDNKITFLNYSEKEFNIATKSRAGANPFDLITAFYQIKEVKEKSDFVAVIFHGGVEHHKYPTLEMVKNFKFMVDAGADCIVSHHTHTYSGMIYYRGKPILFGLGNFLSPTITKVNENWLTGLIAKLKIKEKNISVNLIPVKMNESYTRVDLLNILENRKILDEVNKISGTIENERALRNYWKNENKKDANRLLNIMQSNSRWKYRLRKYLYPVFKTGITDFKLLNILNMVRCSSHQDRMIDILEMIYDQRDK